MRRGQGKSVFIRFAATAVLMVIFLGGCSNPPEYRYQKEADVLAKQSEKAAGSETAKREVHAPATEAGAAPANVESSQAAKVSSAPSVPEVSVSELLLNAKSYDNRKIRVTGRKGKLLPLYNMGFIMDNVKDVHIEVSYGQMPDSDKNTLSDLGMLDKVTISGVWDASRKVLSGEELIR